MPHTNVISWGAVATRSEPAIGLSAQRVTAAAGKGAPQEQEQGQGVVGVGAGAAAAVAATVSKYDGNAR